MIFTIIKVGAIDNLPHLRFLKGYSQFVEAKIDKFYGQSNCVTLDAVRIIVKPCPVNPVVTEVSFHLSAI